MRQLAKLPLPGKSMILTSLARAGLPARSVPARTFSREKASRNRCKGRQKGGFPVAESFASCLINLLHRILFGLPRRFGYIPAYFQNLVWLDLLVDKSGASPFE